MGDVAGWPMACRQSQSGDPCSWPSFQTRPGDADEDDDAGDDGGSGSGSSRTVTNLRSTVSSRGQ